MAAVTDDAVISGEHTTGPALLELPGELRNKIYTLVLGGTHYRIKGDHRVFVNTIFTKTKYHNENDSELVKKNRLAILRTCRQIYGESKTVHAKLSIYHFNDPPAFLCWSAPAGAETVVVDCINIVPFLCAQWFGERAHFVVQAYVYGGEKVTVTNVELKIVVIDADHDSDDIIKTEVMKWGLLCLHDVNEKVKAFKAGVCFTLSVVHRGEKILTMAE